MKKKIKLGLGSIIITASITYLVQYWFRHSGLEDKALNKYDDIKNVFKGDNN